MTSVYTKTPHQKINNHGISSQWEGKHTRFTTVSLGEENKQKANAPPNSKPQFNILINDIKNGSGWSVWYEYGNWYHLGGSKSGIPVIYQLNNQGNKWNKYDNKTKALEYYEIYGKYL